MQVRLYFSLHPVQKVALRLCDSIPRPPKSRFAVAIC